LPSVDTPLVCRFIVSDRGRLFPVQPRRSIVNAVGQLD